MNLPRITPPLRGVRTAFALALLFLPSQFGFAGGPTPIDTPSKEADSLLPGVLADAAVVAGKGRGTDSTANWGVKHYVREQLEKDPDLTRMALHFYRRLRRVDRGWNFEFPALDRGVPIEVPSPVDIYSMAEQEAGGNPYLALKILLIYGHDNQINGFSDWPRPIKTGDLLALDRLKPRLASALYRDRAIPAVAYSSADVQRGQKVAENCADSIGGDFYASRSLSVLCNDEFSSYQADYYHVIFAAFLGCRYAARTAEALPFLENEAVLNPVRRSLDQDIYLDRVRSYKIASFREKIADFYSEAKKFDLSWSKSEVPNAGINLQFAKERAVADAVLRGLDLIEKSDPHFRRAADTLKGGAKKFALATLERMDFEVGFRVRQHRAGLRFGMKTCDRWFRERSRKSCLN